MKGSCSQLPLPHGHGQSGQPGTDGMVELGRSQSGRSGRSGRLMLGKCGWSGSLGSSGKLMLGKCGRSGSLGRSGNMRLGGGGEGGGEGGGGEGGGDGDLGSATSLDSMTKLGSFAWSSAKLSASSAPRTDCDDSSSAEAGGRICTSMTNEPASMRSICTRDGGMPSAEASPSLKPLESNPAAESPATVNLAKTALAAGGDGGGLDGGGTGKGRGIDDPLEVPPTAPRGCSPDDEAGSSVRTRLPDKACSAVTATTATTIAMTVRMQAQRAYLRRLRPFAVSPLLGSTSNVSGGRSSKLTRPRVWWRLTPLRAMAVASSSAADGSIGASRS
mmetsp:Transcript_37277/g.87533  ORF Transcript_37277/g.87533 Transcript_37277/m.87533 type:complete len:331 (+) Transcript_37277:2716-3708(+)